MDKKIGKYLLLLLVKIVVIPLYAAPHIEMLVTDINGEPLQQAQIYIPFIIQVTVVNDETDELPKPEITGLDQFKIVQTSSQSSTVINNGEKTVSKNYHFIVKADEEKVYTIGPCSAHFSNKTETSNPVKLLVTKEQKIAQHQSVFTEITFDQHKVYVGQKATFTLRFYYLEHKARLQQIKEPSFEGFSTSKLQGPATGRKEIEGITYHYLEWKGFFYPLQSGLLTIDPVEAIYTVQAKRRGHSSGFGFFSDMADFFGESRMTKRAFSNTLQLDVRPLPEYTFPVKAVGNFSQLQANMNTHKAGQGEGIVLTLELTGTGNNEHISHPLLELPQELTYYESTAKITQQETQKQFEYIIQATQAGDFTIPEQKFTFFDPQSGTYKTIHSQPLTLTVTPSENTVQEDLATETTHNVPEQKNEIPALITQSNWYAKQQKSLPLWLFITLFSIPLLLQLLLILYKKRKQYLALYAPELAYKIAFKTARSAISHARKSGYNSRLYHIFIDLFAARFKISREQVTEDFIEHTLKQQWDAHKLMKWRLFFGHMTESTFSSYGTTVRDDGLFNHATFWLQELEKIV